MGQRLEAAPQTLASDQREVGFCRVSLGETIFLIVILCCSEVVAVIYNAVQLIQE